MILETYIFCPSLDAWRFHSPMGVMVRRCCTSSRFHLFNFPPIYRGYVAYAQVHLCRHSLC